MVKKSAAQLRRLEKRAAKRGEEYVPPVEAEIPSTNDGDKDNSVVNEEPVSTETNENGDTQINQKLQTIALRLKKELQEIETNSDLVSKDRRSAKRKAEAIAAEESGMPITELFLAGLNVTYKGLQVFRGMAITKLHLRHLDITDKGREIFKDMPCTNIVANIPIITRTVSSPNSP